MSKSKADKALSDPARLLRTLDYDPKTGELTWKERAVDAFKGSYRYGPERAARIWNTRFSGRPALCTLHSGGYLMGTLFGEVVLAHRAIWVLAYGALPLKGFMLDHRNGNRKDNRLDNLRLVNIHQNNTNRIVSRASKTGLKGVSFHSQSGLWRAMISDGNRQKSLGYFRTPDEAADAYRQAARHYHGDYGCCGQRM